MSKGKEFNAKEYKKLLGLALLTELTVLIKAKNIIEAYCIQEETKSKYKKQRGVTGRDCLGYVLRQIEATKKRIKKISKELEPL